MRALGVELDRVELYHDDLVANDVVPRLEGRGDLDGPALLEQEALVPPVVGGHVVAGQQARLGDLEPRQRGRVHGGAVAAALGHVREHGPVRVRPAVGDLVGVVALVPVRDELGAGADGGVVHVGNRLADAARDVGRHGVVDWVQGPDSLVEALLALLVLVVFVSVPWVLELAISHHRAETDPMTCFPSYSYQRTPPWASVPTAQESATRVLESIMLKA